MENAAYEQAATLHKDRVHSYAAHMLRDREEARDVAQEALVRLWQNRGQVDKEGARLWLMRTTHNLCIDRIRKRKVRGEVDGEKLIPIEPDVSPGPQQLTESGELGKMIDEALGMLSPVDRAVVVMREVQGLPYSDIADALDLPLGTLKARLHRARERLRTRLVRAGAHP
jgi:RNA polymerase sigma-70 factor (ECF subfamily)